MAGQTNELIESMEKMKEVQRIQYDYFKHLTTLSASSILIIVAFLEKVFNSPNCIILALISILCFALCLTASLWILPVTGNIILYITGIRVLAANAEKDGEKQAETLSKKIDDSLDKINVYDWFTKITFLLGVVMFLIFVFINFFCAHTFIPYQS